MRSFICFLLCIPLLISCDATLTYKKKKKEKTEQPGKLSSNQVYRVKEIGWKTKIPEGWKILTEKEKQQENNKGAAAIEEATGQNLNPSGMINLISISKDQFNSFSSTMEPFNEERDGNYDDRNTEMHEIIKQTYRAKKIDADYEVAATRIDDVMFDEYRITIYAPDRKKIILEQTIYSALINGYDFAMTLSYNNKADKIKMLYIVRNSEFSIKN